MTVLWLVLTAVLAVLASGTASAHALDPGYLELVPLDQHRWQVTWRVPDVNGEPMPLEARLPETCTHEPPPPSFDGRAWTASWIATCPEGVQGGRIEIAGLERSRTETLVRYGLVPGQTETLRLTASRTAFVIPRVPGKLDTVSSYVALGVVHILEGMDHLLFVLTLLLLIAGWRRLFRAVTAFTAAHSLTLAAATLGWLSVPPAPVEAVIALSIVFLAYELSRPPGIRDPLLMRAPWLISFAFGLIHGLGFAGALREIGLPQQDIPLALLAFNIGVELGQILFIAGVLMVGYSARWLLPAIRTRAAGLERLASYGIGSLAGFWVIERVLGF